MKLHWEELEDGVFYSERAEVPGGWLYRSFDKEHGILSTVFVPDPEAETSFYRLFKSLLDWLYQGGFR